jgi:hypothetical protein
VKDLQINKKKKQKIVERHIYPMTVVSSHCHELLSSLTTLNIISRKFLGVSLIWTFFSHVGAIFYETVLNGSGQNE